MDRRRMEDIKKRIEEGETISEEDKIFAGLIEDPKKKDKKKLKKVSTLGDTSSYIEQMMLTNMSKLSQLQKTRSSLADDKQSPIKYGTEEAGYESTLDKTCVNLVYHINRYIEDCSPMCVYIPSNEVMFKMMRACLEVKEIKDLWMFNEKYSKRVVDTTVENEESQAMEDEN